MVRTRQSKSSLTKPSAKPQLQKSTKPFKDSVALDGYVQILSVLETEGALKGQLFGAKRGTKLIETIKSKCKSMIRIDFEWTNLKSMIRTINKYRQDLTKHLIESLTLASRFRSLIPVPMFECIMSYVRARFGSKAYTTLERIETVLKNGVFGEYYQWDILIMAIVWAIDIGSLVPFIPPAKAQQNRNGLKTAFLRNPHFLFCKASPTASTDQTDYYRSSFMQMNVFMNNLPRFIDNTFKQMAAEMNDEFKEEGKRINSNCGDFGMLYHNTNGTTFQVGGTVLERLKTQIKSTQQQITRIETEIDTMKRQYDNWKSGLLIEKTNKLSEIVSREAVLYETNTSLRSLERDLVVNSKAAIVHFWNCYKYQNTIYSGIETGSIIGVATHPLSIFVANTVLGSGSFGQVVSASAFVFENRRTASVIVKICKKQTDIQQEIDVLSYLNNHNVTNVPTLFCNKMVQNSNGDCLMIMNADSEEYIPLNILIRTHYSFTKEMKELMLFSISITLKKLHSLNVCWVDGKPGNILYNIKKGNVKLIDFGESIVFGASGGETIDLASKPYSPGTKGYQSPEVVCQQKLTLRSDVYALAMIWYRLSDYDCDLPEFNNKQEYDGQMAVIAKKMESDLFRKCVIFNPVDRICINELCDKLFQKLYQK